MDLHKHPFTPSAQRLQQSLGDSTGLTKTGIHICRLPAGKASTTLHWHSSDDEWFFVLEAGDNALVDIMEHVGHAGAITQRRIQMGDFLGFAAGPHNAHRFYAGDSDLVYLCGGSREKMDMSVYPEIGKRLVTLRDAEVGSWSVDEADVKPAKVE